MISGARRLPLHYVTIRTSSRQTRNAQSAWPSQPRFD